MLGHGGVGKDGVCEVVVLPCGTNSLMAPIGQTSKHAPQALQRFASIDAVPPNSRIAFCGHTSRHCPHPEHLASSTINVMVTSVSSG